MEAPGRFRARLALSTIKQIRNRFQNAFRAARENTVNMKTAQFPLVSVSRDIFVFKVSQFQLPRLVLKVVLEVSVRQDMRALRVVLCQHLVNLERFQQCRAVYAVLGVLQDFFVLQL